MKHYSYTQNKTKQTLLLCGVLLVLASASCKKFLEVDFPKQLTKSELVFTSDVSATSAMYGVYSTLYGNASFADGTDNSLTALTSLSSDELITDGQTNQTTVQFGENALQTDNNKVLPLWKSMYQAIYQCNAVLAGLNTSAGVSSATKNQLRGEALFVRAFCNFYLVNLFGDVPLVLTTDYETNAAMKRSSSTALYAQIKADLLEAQSLISENYPSKDIFTPAERIRPNKATATALLARVYLYTENWAEAETQATTLINNTALYELDQSSNLSGVFGANSKEAIWQLKPFYNGTYTNEGYFYAVNDIAQVSNVLRPTLVNAFEELPLPDRRKTNWIKTITAGAASQSRPLKYKNFDDSGFPAEYSMIFRLAEQYLIRAEARAQLDKIIAARDDINAIINRAGLQNTGASTKAQLLTAIEQERRVELFVEWGHRWFDLKRWGRAQAVLGPIKPGFTASDEFYPIPQSEINKNPNLK